jgi:hypothetical protein
VENFLEKEKNQDKICEREKKKEIFLREKKNILARDRRVGKKI